VAPRVAGRFAPAQLARYRQANSGPAGNTTRPPRLSPGQQARLRSEADQEPPRSTTLARYLSGPSLPDSPTPVRGAPTVSRCHDPADRSAGRSPSRDSRIAATGGTRGPRLAGINRVARYDSPYRNYAITCRRAALRSHPRFSPTCHRRWLRRRRIRSATIRPAHSRCPTRLTR